MKYVALNLLLLISMLAAHHPAGAQDLTSGVGMTIARLEWGAGGDWYVSPSALPNLLREIRERTSIPVAEREATVTLSDANLRSYPVLYMTGHGSLRFTPAERVKLREYLLAGGFLLANDSYGLAETFRREISKVFPDSPLTELPADHPIFHTVYDFPKGLPKIHEHDGKPPQAFGIFHEGRLVVLFVYESDIGDGWEDPSVHGDPAELREAAFKMGVNIFVYALSQVAR